MSLAHPVFFSCLLALLLSGCGGADSAAGASSDDPLASLAQPRDLLDDDDPRPIAATPAAAPTSRGVEPLRAARQASRLGTGEHLLASNSEALQAAEQRLVMQSDGNLCHYGHGVFRGCTMIVPGVRGLPAWSADLRPEKLVLDGGVLKLVSQRNCPQGATRVIGEYPHARGTEFELHADGRLTLGGAAVSLPSFQPVQSPVCAAGHRMQVEKGGELRGNANDAITSSNGQHRLVMQSDGNLCRYRHGGFAGCTMIGPWSGEASRRVPVTPQGLRLAHDGALILFGTQGCEHGVDRILARYPARGQRLRMEDDGRLHLDGVDVNLVAFQADSYASCVTGDATQAVTTPPPGTPYYNKYMRSHGVHIYGTPNASEWAVRNMHEVVTQMLNALRDPRARSRFDGARVVVMNYGDRPTTLPFMEGVDRNYLREVELNLRGFSGGKMMTLVTEEMMCKTGVASRQFDRTYRSFDQAVHEWAHTMEGTLGLRDQSHAVIARSTLHAGWKGSPVEAFAMVVQGWFGVNGFDAGMYNGRDVLRSREPHIHQYLASIFQEGQRWIPVCR